MVPERDFHEQMTTLATCLPIRDGATMENDARNRTYFRHLGALNRDDFVEACARIIYQDEWFPTIARVRAVAADCAADRARRKAATEQRRPVPQLVCPYCHGARWVRLGGSDPMQMKAGEEGSRSQPCPKCTTGGRFDADKERRLIADEGGVPNPEPPREVDMDAVTWPAKMAELRDPATGRIDMEALYRLSRELRGLDPFGDDRPEPVPGFASIGRRRELEAVR